MKRILLPILLAASLSYGWVTSERNTGGALDTASIIATIGDNTVQYTAATLLSRGEDIRVLFMCDDTSSAGFASDSIAVLWGYQTGSITRDSANNVDTAWDERVRVDTCVVDSFGKANVGYVSSDGTLTREWMRVDTSSVTGYAVQSRWFVPEWDELIRYWVEGTAANNAGGDNVYKFETHRRQYVQVRSQ